MKLISEENKVPRTLFEARQEAGSVKYRLNKVKQYGTVLLFKVNVFVQFKRNLGVLSINMSNVIRH